MFCGDDDDIIMHDPHWTPPSTPSPSYDWDDTHLDGRQFSILFWPVIPSTIKSDDNNEEWRIEYQRLILNIVPIIRNLITTITSICMASYDHMARFLLTRGQHSYDCRCHTCYDWTKNSISNQQIYSITTRL